MSITLKADVHWTSSGLSPETLGVPLGSAFPHAAPLESFEARGHPQHLGQATETDDKAVPPRPLVLPLGLGCALTMGLAIHHFCHQTTRPRKYSVWPGSSRKRDWNCLEKLLCSQDGQSPWLGTLSSRHV